MRVVVTGPTNAYGRAIVEALAAAGHAVRAFGVPPGEDPFPGVENVQCHPGRVDVGGSIEPVLSQRDALVHAACLDPPGKDASAHAFKIERGTLYARYGAEREMVDHFIHLSLARPHRRFAEVQKQADAHAEATRGTVNVRVLKAQDDPVATAREVLRTLEGLPELGDLPGADNAVTT